MDVIINSGLAFLEGFALIISPCILPILPIILSGSLAGGKRHPIGIIVGFVVVFAVFTLFARQLVGLIGIDLNVLRDMSFILLLCFGFILLSTYLTERFNHVFERLANFGANVAVLNNPKGGFWSGFLFGSLVGLVWTPCAGPILAAVIVQSVSQTTAWGSLITVLAFGIGAAVPMLLIALLGRSVTQKMTFFRDHAGLLRKLLGLIIIASVMAMIASNTMNTPFTRHASNPQMQMTQDAAIPADNTPAIPLHLEKGLKIPYAAPALVGLNNWINSPGLTLENVLGQVVLIDFWAYSCINCIRTLPHVNAWYEKYHDHGFTVIGVHSPEFDFERDPHNVETAVKKYGITYPVALDNQFLTWKNYHNSYWPAHYLIDKTGKVVYERFGEGDYDITENNIRYLLGLHAGELSAVNTETAGLFQTPETYLGYSRADSFAVPHSLVKDQVEHYQYPQNIVENNWALQGAWQVFPEKIVSSEAGAAIKMKFHAGKVFAVMGSSMQQEIQVTVALDGVVKGHVLVRDHWLYTLVELPTSAHSVLELTANAPGLEIYTFTFGQ